MTPAEADVRAIEAAKRVERAAQYGQSVWSMQRVHAELTAARQMQQDVRGEAAKAAGEWQDFLTWVDAS